MSGPPLTIIPTYLTRVQDVEMLEDCLKSLRGTTGTLLEVLLVDDGTPDANLKKALQQLADRYDCEVHLKNENSGFSATVNVGLRKARDEYRDAILCNSDIEFNDQHWLDAMVTQDCLLSKGKASVVGGLLTYGQGIIQHAGIYFSLLTRSFDHRFKYAPQNLPAAQEAKTLPVTAALQLIRHECLTTVGIYDERFKMSFEDVDYCIRVFKAGRECVYQPKVRAIHHESMFRGGASDKVRRWENQSLGYLFEKWKDQSFAGLVPFQ